LSKCWFALAASGRGAARSWDAAAPATVDNLVLLTFAEAEAHERAGLADARARDPAFAAHVEAALARARADHAIRELP